VSPVVSGVVARLNDVVSPPLASASSAAETSGARTVLPLRVRSAATSFDFCVRRSCSLSR
jgi:hypothetical protein